EKLNEIGLPVSKPYALGRNSKSEYGLITSFDGTPLPFECIEIRNIREMANLMARVHKTEISQINRHIPKHEDFIGYFFQITEEHSDISHLIQEILKGITISS